MRILVTGATGFVGSRLAERLADDGHTVVGLARSPASAQKLVDRGTKFVQGDLSQLPAIRAAVQRCEAVFHLAAVYRIGIPRRERAAMVDANVTGTERLLDAALEEGVARIVHVSTINAFGNTQGQVVDETYQRPLDQGFLSCYDETKYRAHEAARARIADGAPISIAQPGQIYGRGDQSEVGQQLARAAAGTLPYLTFPEVGLVFCHVDDIVGGLLGVLERGRAGEAYVLGGTRSTLGEACSLAARVTGRSPPLRTLPRWALQAAAPLGPLLSRLTGLPPNLREVIRASNGVTYWASDEKARSELGYTPRGLEDGLRQLFTAVAPA